MRRLKAVMNPAAPAGRDIRVVAAVLGLSLMGATGATTAALASQREPEFRVPAAQAGAWGPRFDLPYEFRINGQRIDINPATLPPFGFAGEEIKSSERQGSEAPAWVDVRVTVDPSAPPLSLEGVALPHGVRPDVIMPEFVERIDRSESGLNIVLKREAKPDAPSQARPSPDARPSRLTPEQQNRYQRVSASQFQTICASGQPSDDGFCAGVMFSFLTRAPSQNMCLPGDDETVDGPALSAYVDRAKVQVAGLSPRADEGAYEFAGRALAIAYPCAARAAQDGGAGL